MKKSACSMSISATMDFVGGLTSGNPRLLRALGNLETGAIRDLLPEGKIYKPVYITGAARSGSTIILEFLSRLPTVATHRYRDYPALLIPYWWNWFQDHASRGDQKPSERAHGDRIYITKESPEAMEEMVWMAFFSRLHEADYTQILSGDVSDPEFERFYKDHIRKILFLRKGKRYVAKANYHVSRIQYILSLFHDARFIIPVRNPIDHVASLVKQHAMFLKLEKEDPRILHYMNRVGHYEFGLNFTPINFGSTTQVELMAKAVEEGRAFEAYARYWRQIYHYLHDLSQYFDPKNSPCFFVKYEDLCDHSEQTLKQIIEHAELFAPEEVQTDFSSRLTRPSYYSPTFSETEEKIIWEITEDTASLFGYSRRNE